MERTARAARETSCFGDNAWKEPRAEFLLLRAEELIVTISVVWMSEEKKKGKKEGKEISGHDKKFRERKRMKVDAGCVNLRGSSRVLCVLCGWPSADAFRSRRQECVKKRPASDKL